MKKDGAYRFNLQFSADTAERIRAGELLEKKKKKKSSVIVPALNEYLERHPELQTEALRIQIKEADALRKEKLEDMIRQIVREQIGGMAVPNEEQLQEIPADSLEEDVARMIDNLDIFQQ